MILKAPIPISPEIDQMFELFISQISDPSTSFVEDTQALESFIQTCGADAARQVTLTGMMLGMFNVFHYLCPMGKADPFVQAKLSALRSQQ